jgi:hypothetical protein
MPGVDEHDEFLVEELLELELDATPAPAPTVDDRRRLAQQLAAQARKPKLADRAPRPQSAMDVIAAAMAAEESVKDAGLAEKRRVAAALAARAEATRQRAEEEAERDRLAAADAEADRHALDDAAASATGRRAPRAARPLVPVGAGRATRPEHTDPFGRMVVEGKVDRILGELTSGIDVVDLFMEVPAAVVGPLWQAHQIRALHDGDLALAAMVGAVRQVVSDRVRDVVAARVSWKGDSWAVWFDMDEERVLAVLRPAEVYLIGVA